MFEYLDFKTIRQKRNELSDFYHSAAPFKHVLTQDLIRPEKLDELFCAFPGMAWPYWNSYPSEHAPKTLVCESTANIPLQICRLLAELNSGPFLEFLEKLTGIDNLIPDTHYRGAGMHLTLPGGTLTPHIDHHVLPEHPKYRQLNLILYLSKNWSAKNQGFFELWDKRCTKVEKEISPSHGNCLIFGTKDSAMHGFSKPVKILPRRSISIFYYTATESDADHYGGHAATFWQPKVLKPEGIGDYSRLLLQQMMWNSSRLFGKLSWAVSRSALTLSRKRD